MKHLFIVNPAAGKTDRTGTVNAAVASAFVGRSDEYEVVVSRAPGHCTKLARAACETGEELRIYACGGDGTLNEIVNGIMGSFVRSECPPAPARTASAPEDGIFDEEPGDAGERG